MDFCKTMAFEDRTDRSSRECIVFCNLYYLCVVFLDTELTWLCHMKLSRIQRAIRKPGFDTGIACSMGEVRMLSESVK